MEECSFSRGGLPSWALHTLTPLGLNKCSIDRICANAIQDYVSPVTWILRESCNMDLVTWEHVFPPDKHDFRNSVSLNAFASKVATSAVILGHSNKDLQIIYLPYF